MYELGDRILNTNNELEAANSKYGHFNGTNLERRVLDGTDLFGHQKKLLSSSRCGGGFRFSDFESAGSRASMGSFFPKYL